MSLAFVNCDSRVSPAMASRNSFLSHSCSSVLNPEFSQAQQPRQTKTAHCGNQVSYPCFANRHPFQQPCEVHDRKHYLASPVEWQQNVPDPVHKCQEGDPIAVWVVPGCLIAEGLHRAQ